MAHRRGRVALRLSALFAALVLLVGMDASSVAARDGTVVPRPVTLRVAGEAATATTPQPRVQHTFVEGQIGGIHMAIAVQGQYLDTGVGPTLAVLDISNLGAPTVVGSARSAPGVRPDRASRDSALSAPAPARFPWKQSL
jgi:hypothetical protein